MTLPQTLRARNEFKTTLSRKADSTRDRSASIVEVPHGRLLLRKSSPAESIASGNFHRVKGDHVYHKERPDSFFCSIRLSAPFGLIEDVKDVGKRDR